MIEHHDIIETLRIHAETAEDIGCHNDAFLFRKAAREIEELRKLVDDLGKIIDDSKLPPVMSMLTVNHHGIGTKPLPDDSPAAYHGLRMAPKTPRPTVKNHKR
jgi:hypothetical protein